MKILTRGSALALAQARLVQDAFGGEITVLSTRGDREADKPLKDIGGKGLFVKELEEGLISGRGDIAVNSAKDMPRTLPDGLCIKAVLAREEPFDCILSRSPFSGRGKIGTSSMRRSVQLSSLYPDAQILPIRGNVDGRIKKLRDGVVDAIVLAKAGLNRLSPDLSGLTVRVFSPDEMIPAACQGIIALEGAISSPISFPDDENTRFSFEAERAFLDYVKADCGACVACFVERSGENYAVRALYNGKKFFAVCPSGEVKEKLREFAKECL